MSTDLYKVSLQLPKQKLLVKQKDDAWRQQCIDAIDGMATASARNGRTSKARKKTNYNLVNSIFDEADYDYVLNPYNFSGQYGGTPARIRDINQIRNKVERLKAAELIRPFPFMVAGIGGEVINARQEKLHAERVKFITQKIQEEAGITPEEVSKFKSFQEIEDWHSRHYRDPREEWGNAMIETGMEQERLRMKFNQGWEHGIIAAEELYYVGIVSGRPTVRVCEPMQCEWDKSPELLNTNDSDWFREERFMSVAQIVDEFGEFLSDDQIDEMENGFPFENSMYPRDRMYPGYAYTADYVSKREFNWDSSRSRSAYIRVVTGSWKSRKKIGFLQYKDEQGEWQETIVDETRRLTTEEKAQGAKIEWRWISEVWMGTKIGSRFYIDINPIPNQMRTIMNPSECKLPYVGRMYNNVNTESRSLVDLAKPHQYLLNIVWYRLENELAKAKGKKMTIDMAQIPRSEGMDLDKWMYYFDNVGINFINSHEESKKGKTASFNQFQEHDLSLSNVVGEYMKVIEKLESLIELMMGVNAQSQGQTNPYETAGGVSAAISQAGLVAEPMFFIHDEVKRDVLKQYVEVCKYAYIDSGRLEWITEDFVRKSVEFDGEVFNDSDYNVFIVNTAKEQQLRLDLKELAKMALQQDRASFSDMIKVLRSNSVSGIERQVIKSEEEKHQRDAEAGQQQQQQAQAALQQKQQHEDMEREYRRVKDELDRENKIQVATISTMGFDTEKDRNLNNVPDVLETGRLALETSRVNYELLNKQKDREDQTSNKEKDRQLKREEIASRERIEQLKAKTALKNKVSGQK